MRTTACLCVVLVSLGVAACGGDSASAVEPSNFSVVIDNPFLPWEPGTTFKYRSTSADGVDEITVVVTNKTKVVDGVTTRVVRDTARHGSKVLEDTSDYYAQDRDGNVWYFGEDTTSYESGKPDHEGTWHSGVDGAKAGIVMEAHPKVGDSYSQEDYPGHAEDQAKVVSLNAKESSPYGSFDHMVKTKETTLLDKSSVEYKYYARGVGSVVELDPGNEERVELLSVEHS